MIEELTIAVKLNDKRIFSSSILKHLPYVLFKKIFYEKTNDGELWLMHSLLKFYFINCQLIQLTQMTLSKKLKRIRTNPITTCEKQTRSRKMVNSHLFIYRWLYYSKRHLIAFWISLLCHTEFVWNNLEIQNKTRCLICLFNGSFWDSANGHWFVQIVCGIIEKFKT